VNKPRCPVMHYQRDGVMATAEDYKGLTANYWPNSRDGNPAPKPDVKDPAWDLGQVIVDRHDSKADHDEFTQAGNLWRLFDDGQKDRTTSAIAGALSQARQEVQMRQLCHFFRADEEYGKMVAEKLGIDVEAAMAGANGVAAHA